MDILSCSNSCIVSNSSFLQSNLRNKRPKQRQSFYTFYPFLSILLLSILYISILYISFYTCITTIKHAEDWDQLVLGNESRHHRYFKLHVLSFKCTVLRLIVINEICHISRKRWISRNRLKQGPKFLKLQEAICLTVVDEIFKFPRHLDLFSQVNYLCELLSGYPSHSIQKWYIWASFQTFVHRHFVNYRMLYS